MKALVINPDGTQAMEDLDSLEDWQRVVGGNVEEIPLPGCGLMINEDGIALDLPVNPLATRFAKRELARDGRILLSADGWILGTTFVIGEPDDEGDSTDSPYTQIAWDGTPT